MGKKGDRSDSMADLLAELGYDGVPPHERVAQRLVAAAGGEVSGDPARLPDLINSLGATAEIDSILDETHSSRAVARAVAHLLQYPDGIAHRSLVLRYALIDMLMDEHEEDAHRMEPSRCEPYMITAVNLLRERGGPAEHGWAGTAPLIIRALPIALVLAAIMIRALHRDGDTDMPELHLRVKRHEDLLRVAEDHPEDAYRLAEFVIAHGLDAARARSFLEDDIPAPLADGVL